MKLRRVYLSGWSGQRNAGDDAFAIVVAWGLRQFHGTRTFILERDVSGLPKDLCPFRLVQSNPFRIPALPRFRRAYFSWLADTLVLSGGTLLPNLYEVRRLLAEDRWRKGTRSTIALGLSVGPFESVEHEKLTAEYLNQLSFVGFRDDFSYDWAVASGLKSRFARAFDLALLLPRAARQSKPTGEQNALGISLLSRHSESPEKLSDADLSFVKSIAKVLSDIQSERQSHMIVFSLCRNSVLNDDPIADAFVQNYTGGPVEIVQHLGDANQTYSQIQRCSHMISMRLHGSIFSYMSGIPCLTLEYQRKCRDFAETVGNDPRLCLSMGTFDADHFRDSVQYLLTLKSPNTKLSVSQAEERSLLNFQF